MSKQNWELLYQPDIDKVIERSRSWFDPEGKVKYLVNVIPDFWNSYNWDLRIDVKSPRALEEYNFNNYEQLCEYIDHELSLIQEYWEKKLEWKVKDDFVPSQKVKFGWAESVAAIAGVEPVYQAQSSYIKAIINNYEDFDFDRIRFSEQSNLSQVLFKGTEYLLKKAKGKFLVAPRIDSINPGDIAHAYRGTPFLTDFYDNSQYVHKLLTKCTQEAIKFIEWFYKIAGAFKEGFPCTWNGGYWVPGTILGHTGDNVSDLVSADIFSNFLLPYIGQLSEYFAGSIFGRDVSSSQLWSEIKKISKIKAFKPRKIGNHLLDTKIIEKIIEKTEGIPLILEAEDKEKFLRFKDVVCKNKVKTFFIVHCKSREEAREVVDAVREI